MSGTYGEPDWATVTSGKADATADAGPTTTSSAAAAASMLLLLLLFLSLLLLLFMTISRCAGERSSSWKPNESILHANSLPDAAGFFSLAPCLRTYYVRTPFSVPSS